MEQVLNLAADVALRDGTAGVARDDDRGLVTYCGRSPISDSAEK